MEVRSSAGKRTPHVKIKCFHVTDAHNQGDLETQYCSTNGMTADYMTKASQGTKCKLMRCKTMNVAVNKSEAEKKGIENPKSILKKKAVRFKIQGN